MCAVNVLLIKHLQHISGSFTMHEITQRFLVQRMKGVNSFLSWFFNVPYKVKKEKTKVTYKMSSMPL